MTLEDLTLSPHFRPRMRGVIPLDEWEALTSEGQRRRLAAGWLPPMAGADGEGDDDPPEDDESEDDDTDANAEKDQEDDSESEDESGDEDDSDDPAEALREARVEIRALSKRAEDAEKRARKAERAQARKRQEGREKQGEFERLYNEEKEAREKLEAQVAADKMGGAITTVATRLKFRNPQVAARLISLDDDVEPDDSDTIERALKKLLKAEPYLAQGNRAQRTDTDSANGNGRDSRGRRRSGEDDDRSPEEMLRDHHASIS